MFYRRVKSALGRLANRPIPASWLSHVGEPLFRLMGKRRGPAELDLSQVKSVLVVRLDEIGDLVMTTPFLRELRHNLQDAWITLAVDEKTYNLAEHCPYVDEVLVHRGRVPGRFGGIKNFMRTFDFARRHFWRRRLDLAIVPRWDADHNYATYLAYLSGAAWRVGFSERVIPSKAGLNAGYDSLFTHTVDDPRLKHEVGHSLDLISAMGGTVRRIGLEFWCRQADEDFARQVLEEHGVGPEDRLVALSASGGNSRLKQWPVENFVEVADWLETDYGLRVVLLGGPADIPLGRRVRTGLGPSVIDMTGKTTLRQAGALLMECCLYVGADTGLMHLAASCGTPVAAVFGASCPHRFGPWGRRHKVLSASLPCGPCHGGSHIDRCGPCPHAEPICMRSIPPALVKAAISKQLVSLGEFPPPPREVPMEDPALIC
jgi:ADP-heptose:LPS heptosyltransferase